MTIITFLLISGSALAWSDMTPNSPLPLWPESKADELPYCTPMILRPCRQQPPKDQQERADRKAAAEDAVGTSIPLAEINPAVHAFCGDHPDAECTRFRGRAVRCWQQIVGKGWVLVNLRATARAMHITLRRAAELLNDPVAFVAAEAPKAMNGGQFEKRLLNGCLSEAIGEIEWEFEK